MKSVAWHQLVFYCVVLYCMAYECCNMWNKNTVTYDYGIRNGRLQEVEVAEEEEMKRERERQVIAARELAMQRQVRSTVGLEGYGRMGLSISSQPPGRIQ